MNLNLTMNSVFVLDGVMLLLIGLAQLGFWLTSRNMFRNVSIAGISTLLLIIALTFPHKVALAETVTRQYGVVLSGGMIGEREHWIQFYQNEKLTQADGSAQFIRFCQDDPLYPGVIIDDLKYRPQLDCWYWKQFTLRRNYDGTLILAAIR